FGKFNSVYLGGGTPSALQRKQLARLIDYAWSVFTISHDREASIEVNPGDMDGEYCSFLRDTPLNRINLGVQSFDDAILTYLGRRHRAADALASMETLRNSGFGNIGLDLIYSIPGQSMESWISTLERAILSEPEHLSCYELTPEPGTLIGDRCFSGKDRLPDENLRLEFFMATSERLEKAGYIHYEVSNFSRGNALRSRHNMKYWNHSTYLGLGPSAHSFRGNRRWWNHRSLEAYCSDLSENRRPIEESETLTPEDMRLEKIFLGLRTKEGISMELMEASDGIAGTEGILSDSILKQCVDGKILEIREGRIRPTRRGLALADRLAVML
ncbi:MAG: radical SAM family heme chaperone HemW, partial [Syntrophales bacterium]|nr:radical SAM family heme chaperone HemW [Syntrophales bacterium]